MAIIASDIQFLQSERMTDADNAGGFATNIQVLDNIDNNVFPDISSGDHVTGYTELRLIYGAVRSSDTDTYFSSRVYIASPPNEAGVNTFLFPASPGDARTDYIEELYKYTNKGSNSNYRLYADYGLGATSVDVYKAGFQSSRPSKFFTSGQQIILEDVGAGSFQVCEITSVGTVSYKYTAGVLDYEIYRLELSAPLTAVFNGAYYTDEDHEDYVTPTQIYYLNPQPILIYGISPVETQAEIDDTTVEVTALDCPLSARASLDQSQIQQHIGIWNNYFDSDYHVYTASAAASRVQAFTVIDADRNLEKVIYRYQGAWVTEEFNVAANGGYYLTVLANIPDSGSTLLYITGNETYGTFAITAFVFLLNAPVIPGSLVLTGVSAAGAVLGATDDGAGAWTGGGSASAGAISYSTGLVTATLPSSYPLDVYLEYRVDVYSSATPNTGIELVKLPPSKAAPLFRVGDSVLVHHTDHETLTNPVVASTTYTLNRANVDQVWLEALDGTRIPTSKYTVNLTIASVTMAAGLDLSGYQQPLEAYTTIHDEAVILSIDGAVLQLNQALTHQYPADESYVSSILQCGDLYASVTVPFSQQAWTAVWSDARIGDPITPQFSYVTYPLVVTNDGAITERWRIQFTAATTVNVIGEKVGQVATSISITSDIAPVNPYTGQPYFTIPYEGWGAAWVNGNLLRFNTASADAAIGIGRSIQPGAHTPGVSDRIRLTFLGDVNA